MFAIATVPAFGAGEHHPFPQHTVYTPGTIKPSAKSQAALNQAVTDFYKIWKQKYLRPAEEGQLYVFANAEKTLDSPDTRSVSEGHGYGMLASVLMAGADPEAHEQFDALYRFFRAHPTETHRDLMAWRQILKPHTKTLTEAKGDRDSATDGDLDIAYALLLADRQWGSDGPIRYRAEALKVMAAILNGETDPRRQTLTLGDWVDDESPKWGSLRSSDFMPGHLKAFAAASGDARWTQINDTTFRIFDRLVAGFSPETGLVPDFIVPKGDGYCPAPAKFLEARSDGAFSYNACRVPWRLGVDYLLTGDPRSLALLRPLNAWIQKATQGDPAKVNAGYSLDGKPLKEDDSAAFIGPLTVSAMVEAGQQQWLDALWANLLKRDPKDEDYFGNTIKLLTMITASGNWW